MNGTNDKQRQIQDCFSPGAVKAVTKVEHQHHVPRLRGQGGVSGTGWVCPPPLEELKNNSFENSIRTIWYIPFGKILLLKIFQGNLLDTLSCLKILPLFLFFDAFVRTFINL